MKTSKSIIDYQKQKKDSCLIYTMNKSYNEITINPNESFQPTETAGFESIWFNFAKG
jgi:hypothetical protein